MKRQWVEFFLGFQRSVNRPSLFRLSISFRAVRVVETDDQFWFRVSSSATSVVLSIVSLTYIIIIICFKAKINLESHLHDRDSFTLKEYLLYTLPYSRIDEIPQTVTKYHINCHIVLFLTSLIDDWGGERW